MLKHALVSVAALAAAALVAGPASASQLIERDAANVSLKVDAKGQALVEYKVRGVQKHVLVWGAINARIPDARDEYPKVPQVEFKVDYSGGWGTYKRDVWKTFQNRCGAYDGPKLDYLVKACKAPDGSYWALQQWQIELPNLGFAPWTAKQKAMRLQMSHWTGPVAVLEAHTDWIYAGHYHSLFGRFTYRGKPVHGYHTTKFGVPLDGYVRNVYLDTYNSAYGAGWRRENGFVSHTPVGNFCYGFYQFDPLKGGYQYPPGYSAGLRPSGNGEKYRISVQGPGVTPDVVWQGKGLPDYDPDNPELVALEKSMNQLADRISAGDSKCHQH